MDKTANERLQEIDRVLDEYERKKGLPVLSDKESVSKYLELSEEQLGKLSQEELDAASYLLSGLALSVQRELNRELSRVTWAEANIAIFIAGKMSQYSGASFEERKNQAIKNNEYTLKLSQIKTFAQERADRLAFVPTRIENIAGKLDSIAKRKGRYE